LAPAALAFFATSVVIPCLGLPFFLFPPLAAAFLFFVRAAFLPAAIRLGEPLPKLEFFLLTVIVIISNSRKSLPKITNQI
tara:strand:+ start:451 stop:690 length:240 start_codon:yes stop_codon:yes gene_type:complete